MWKRLNARCPFLLSSDSEKTCLCSVIGFWLSSSLRDIVPSDRLQSPLLLSLSRVEKDAELVEGWRVSLTSSAPVSIHALPFSKTWEGSRRRGSLTQPTTTSLSSTPRPLDSRHDGVHPYRRPPLRPLCRLWCVENGAEADWRAAMSHSTSAHSADRAVLDACASPLDRNAH
jgi:hypothetical protein